MEYKEFFERVTGNTPYHYQERLGTEPWPDLVDVPTGLGKTAGVVGAWLWKRLKQQVDTPRRLVYCLPMRVLVEQTQANACGWVEKASELFEDAGLKPPGVYLLMGGEVEDQWELFPERDAILIGTQDMLLSRALNRGYAAGRARWPMDFGLLNNDCLWIFDEVQLMSTGLATSLQLDAWRKTLWLKGNNGFPVEVKNPVALPCRSLWMSATMAKHWLDSAVDWRPYVVDSWDSRCKLEKRDFDHNRVCQLFENNKTLTVKAVAALAKPKNKDDKLETKNLEQSYISQLAEAVKSEHSANDGLTLVILNTVDRAVALYEKMKEKLPHAEIHLIHSRFRPMEREKWRRLFESRDNVPRLIIATQVVEAGIDISASVLFTELAPWAALVQRFGRCARYTNQSGKIYWMDIAVHESTARPYESNEIEEARKILIEVADVGLQTLLDIKSDFDKPEKAIDAKKIFPYDPRFVPRDKDLFDLFDTTPDLTGADVDVSRYIRDGEELDVQVFWREIEPKQSPGKKDKPDRRELCPVAFHRLRGQISGLLKNGRGRAWRWNYRTGWEPLRASQSELIYPGQVFMLDISCGGYNMHLGWTGKSDDTDFEPLPLERRTPHSKLDLQDAEESAEDLSESKEWLTICEHSADLLAEMKSFYALLETSLISAYIYVLILAACWHDRGKAHESFVANLKTEILEQAYRKLKGQPAAKAPKDAWQSPLRGGTAPNDKRRPGFRHELASALAIFETLHQARPDHPAFLWPEGLDKSLLGTEDPVSIEAAISGPAVEKLASLSPEQFDLLLYLVAAHHGKVRMSLRSSPDDSSAEGRQARGVQDTDTLPACLLPNPSDSEGRTLEAPAVTLNLDPMELGLSARYGPSWRERMQKLLERLGPFRLAYLECLLRVADWRASRAEEEKS